MHRIQAQKTSGISTTNQQRRLVKQIRTAPPPGNVRVHVRGAVLRIRKTEGQQAVGTRKATSHKEKKNKPEPEIPAEQ
jgi:hypothetical protein